MNIRKEQAKYRQKRRVIVFLAMTGFLILLCAIAPNITPNDPYKTNPAYLAAAPCRQFPFGTDKLGRCLLSRVMAGAGASVFSGIFLVMITSAAGTVTGMFCGYYGGIADTVLMRGADMLLAFPQMVLAIAVAGILGGGLINAMITLGVTGWTLYARLARSHVLSLKEETYIHAAKVSGCSDIKILFHYMLPDLTGSLIVNAVTQISTTLMSIAGLSFLGLGVQPPNAEWGSMISEAAASIQSAPWAAIAPGGATVITIMVFHFLGDALRDFYDINI